MTGQSLLDMMELINQELQLQTGEENVTKGLLALNVAQDYFESLAAQRPQIVGSSTGTITTTADTETTSLPTGLLRIDRLQLLDSDSRPVREIVPLQRVGGHERSQWWPLNLIATSSTGPPRGYKNYGSSIYWQPLPDATHTIRWYGFQRASDITASGTFAYDDTVAFPLAGFAVHLIKVGLDDVPADVSALASATFQSTLDALNMINRDGGKGLHYTMVHTT